MLPASNLRSGFGANILLLWCNDVPVFEVEDVNVAPGKHGVLLPAFPLLDRADGQAQLGGPGHGLYILIHQRETRERGTKTTDKGKTWECREH